MPRPKLRNLIQLKAETQESYPIYKQEGYERISHVETKHSLRLAIKRVLELNSSSKKPKYFYTRQKQIFYIKTKIILKENK
jgi:hypothetical protein